MNKDVKFRIWDKIIKKYVKYISFENYTLSDANYINRQNIIIEQYSGLKDMYGKEIYSGDFVKLAGVGVCLIEFPFIEIYESCLEKDILNIVGNINENPALIEVMKL